MINTSNSKLHNNTTRTMRDSAMLLLLCRLLVNAVMFCTSAHLRRFRNQCEQGAGKKGWYVGGRSLHKKNSICRLKNRYQFVHPT